MRASIKTMINEFIRSDYYITSDGSTHREAIEDMREGFRSWLHDRRRQSRRLPFAKYPYRIEDEAMAYFDDLIDQELWRSLPPLVRGYIEAAMWTLTDEDGEPLDYLGLHDIAAETIERARQDCAEFEEANRHHMDDTGADDEQHGHDFWLTRNGHGAGFWDRGYGAIGDQLTTAAQLFGSADWYVGDDGLIYQC